MEKEKLIITLRYEGVMAEMFLNVKERLGFKTNTAVIDHLVRNEAAKSEVQQND